MGLDALMAALELDALAAGEALLATAAREAQALRQEVEARVAREREARRQELEQQHAAVAGARVGTATRTAQLQVLEAELASLEGFRVEAEALLAALPFTQWRAAIPELVETVLRYAGDRPVTLRCPPVARDAILAAAAARPGTSVTVVEGMEPGLVLVSDDGRLVVPVTAVSRLAVRWPDLRLELLARLGEDQ